MSVQNRITMTVQDFLTDCLPLQDRAIVRILPKALGPTPCGEGVADPSKRCILHICVTTSNLVVLRQRVYAEIEWNSQTCVPLGSCSPLAAEAWLTPQKYAPPHVCYLAEFGLSVSISTSVIK